MMEDACIALGSSVVTLITCLGICWLRSASLYAEDAELWDRLDAKQIALIDERDRLRERNAEVRDDRKRWEMLYEKACHDRDRYRAMVDRAAEVLCPRPLQDEWVQRSAGEFFRELEERKANDAANGD